MPVALLAQIGTGAWRGATEQASAAPVACEWCGDSSCWIIDGATVPQAAAQLRAKHGASLARSIAFRRYADCVTSPAAGFWRAVYYSI